MTFKTYSDKQMRTYSFRNEVEPDLLTAIAHLPGVAALGSGPRYAVTITKGGAYRWDEVEAAVMPFFEQHEGTEFSTPTPDFQLEYTVELPPRRQSQPVPEEVGADVVEEHEGILHPGDPQ